MIDQNSDIALKVNWANERIRELEKIIDAWIDTNPYAISVKIDPDSREKIYFPTKIPEMPTDFSLRAGEIIQHLSSALDYLACALVEAKGRTPTSGTGFPVLETWPLTKDQRRAFCRKIAGMSIGAVKYILRLKPYKGGNNALWRLHALNNRDKHRLLMTLGVGMGRFNFGQHLRETRKGKPLHSATDLYITPSRTFIVEAGQPLFVDPPNTEINDNPDVRPQIAFNEVGVCEQEAVITQLTTLSNWVSGIVRDCERFLN